MEEEILWLNEVEYPLIEKEGWKIIFVANHFKYKFWYEIEDSEGCTLDFITTDIHEAIHKLEEEISKDQNNF